jgi:ADP-dependent phosphofructokinase/glucokinase
MLKSYRWFIAIADNENIKIDTRVQAQSYALEVVVAVLGLELEGLKLIRRQGSVEKIYANSQSAK